MKGYGTKFLLKSCAQLMATKHTLIREMVCNVISCRQRVRHLRVGHCYSGTLLIRTPRHWDINLREQNFETRKYYFICIIHSSRKVDHLHKYREAAYYLLRYTPGISINEVPLYFIK